jgi:hypothetical protein
MTTSEVSSFVQVASPIASVLLTGVIGLVALLIQHQQAETNRRQLRLHLFDRRWAVYEATMHLTNIIMNKTDITSEELAQFAAATRGTRFLFDKEMQRTKSNVPQNEPLKWNVDSILGVDSMLIVFEPCEDPTGFRRDSKAGREQSTQLKRKEGHEA